MNKIIFHIDFNSYFATVEQQANPRLRGKPIGVTGGDRVKRTVIGAASVEAKRFGVKTGMAIWQAKQLCPQIILVPGDSDKYLETTKRFLNIIKDYSPYVEVFSIDEVFLEIPSSVIPTKVGIYTNNYMDPPIKSEDDILKIAQNIKSRIQTEVGEWITCSIGISYNKIMAKLAGSLYKPDGLVVIADEEAAKFILDRIELDEICGIGFRIKKRLNNMGVFSFKDLRKAPLRALLASFKSYGQILYNMSRGIDNSPITPFYEKEEVKSIGHRHTIDHDTSDPQEIKQILLKLTEMIGRRLRAKKLVGKTISLWYRSAFHSPVIPANAGIYKNNQADLYGSPIKSGMTFEGNGMQATIPYTNDGLEIFKAGWQAFLKIWPASPKTTSRGGDRGEIRMIGVSVSNLKSEIPQTLSLLPETNKQETTIKALDKINDKYGEFTLQRGILLQSENIKRKPNPFLSDRRFKV